MEKILDVDTLSSKYKPRERQCNNCTGYQLVDMEGYRVCMDCGRVNGKQACEGECVDSTTLERATRKSPAYQRKFYFNERCSRWACEEPGIPADLMKVIKREALSKVRVIGDDGKKIAKYPNLQTNCNRELINEILRNADLPRFLVKKYKSQKF